MGQHIFQESQGKIQEKQEEGTLQAARCFQKGRRGFSQNQNESRLRETVDAIIQAQRMIFVRHTLIALACLVSGLLHSQDQLLLELAHDTVRIGDRIYADFKLVGDVDVVDVIWPEIPEKGNLEWIGASEPVQDTAAYETTWIKTYELLSFDTGWVEVPPMQVVLGGESLLSSSARVYQTFPTPDLTGTIEEIKEPVVVHLSNWEEILLYKNEILVGLLAIVLLIIGLIWWKIKARPEQVLSTVKMPPKSADVIAFERLTALQNKDLFTKGLIKEHYIELSNIFRMYVEDRYGIPAMEETSDQLLSNLRSQDVHRGDLSKLKRILELSDMVKFAKSKPTVFDHERVTKDARNFLLNTRLKTEE